MERMQLQLAITLDEKAVAAVVALMREAFPDSTPEDEKREDRMRASRDAIFGGQKPPEDKGLLVDSKQAARLLRVSERTLWRMWNEAQMPAPIRIGRATRWSYDELREWVAAGCPAWAEWEWPRRPSES